MTLAQHPPDNGDDQWGKWHGDSNNNTNHAKGKGKTNAKDPSKGKVTGKGTEPQGAQSGSELSHAPWHHNSSGSDGWQGSSWGTNWNNAWMTDGWQTAPTAMVTPRTPPAPADPSGPATAEEGPQPPPPFTDAQLATMHTEIVEALTETQSHAVHAQSSAELAHMSALDVQNMVNTINSNKVPGRCRSCGSWCFINVNLCLHPGCPRNPVSQELASFWEEHKVLQQGLHTVQTQTAALSAQVQILLYGSGGTPATSSSASSAELSGVQNQIHMISNIITAMVSGQQTVPSVCSSGVHQTIEHVPPPVKAPPHIGTHNVQPPPVSPATAVPPAKAASLATAAPPVKAAPVKAAPPGKASQATGKASPATPAPDKSQMNISSSQPAGQGAATSQSSSAAAGDGHQLISVGDDEDDDEDDDNDEDANGAATGDATAGNGWPLQDKCKSQRKKRKGPSDRPHVKKPKKQ